MSIFTALKNKGNSWRFRLQYFILPSGWNALANNGANFSIPKEHRHLLEHPVRSQADFSSALEKIRQTANGIENSLITAGQKRKQWYAKGFCQVCQHTRLFLLDWTNSDNHTPNFRDRLICSHCMLNNRQRFIFTKAFQLARLEPTRPSVYLHERLTHLYDQVAHRFGSPVVGSEYMGPQFEPGKLIRGVRHEDITCLSFPDESFDIILSNDVFEHVPDYVPAFSENYRVLKPGGTLLFTIPFNSGQSSTRVRAQISNGNINFLSTPVYHGNPIDKRGSLVFHDFGWDILSTCRRVGFQDAHAILYYGPGYGYLGDTGQLLFIARK